MKYGAAFIVTASGWILFLACAFYEYSMHESGLFRLLAGGFITDDNVFHALIFIAPVLSTVVGHRLFAEERTRLYTDIHESKEKYRELYEFAPDGYHTLGPDGSIQEVNNTWLDMLGYERVDVTGGVKITSFLAEESIPVFEQNFPVLKQKGCLNNISCDMKTKDGSVLPVVINARASYDSRGEFISSRSVVRDNTHLKAYEQMLSNASEEWEATFDSMPFGIMILDHEHNIIRANDYMAGLSTVAKDDIIGEKCYRVVHGKGRPIAGCPLEKFPGSGCVETSECYEARLGRHFLVNVAPFLEHGARFAYVHTLIDITELKDKETRLAQSKTAFFNMLTDLSQAHEALKTMHQSLITAFASAIDAKSPWTKGHSERVAYYAVAIASEMGLDKRDLDKLNTAGLLHDIGKMGTWDSILNKRSKLTDEEYDVVKMHPAKGAEILMPIKELSGIIPAVRGHHERFDGNGYPDRLKGEEIPLLARIMCVADSFDSMTADRPYRASPGSEYAVSELKRCSGAQFDPAVVEAFLKILGSNEALEVRAA